MKRRVRRLVEVRTRYRDLAVAAHAAARMSLRDIESRRTDLVASANARTEGEFPVHQLASGSALLERADFDVVSAQARVELSAQRLRIAAASLMRAERLKDRVESQLAKEARRAEQRISDEAGRRRAA